VPIIIGEYGEDANGSDTGACGDGTGGTSTTCYVETFMSHLFTYEFASTTHDGMFAWAWNGQSGNPPSIANGDDTPSAYGQWIYTHYSGCSGPTC
jgi:hypothetical protein